MREKLRNFYGNDKVEKTKDNFDVIVKKFKNESTSFLEGGQNSLPQPLEYYVRVFESSFEFIKENPSEVETLQNKYVTFSERLLAYIKKKDASFGAGQ